MLKRKLKLPDQLGSLVKGFDNNHNRNTEVERRGGMWEISASSFEVGEELETIHSDGSRVGTDRIDDSDDAEQPMEEEEVPVVRPRPEQFTNGFNVVSRIAIEAEDRRSDLEYELSQEEINVEKLQRIASSGIPQGGSLRATTWKLLLGYLPPSRGLWDKVLSESRVKYSKLKEELLSSPSKFSITQEEPSSSTKQDDVETSAAGPLQRHDVSNEDHPLSLREKSVWHKFFEYNEISQQIDRDLERTHPEMKFFSGDSPFSRKTREAMKNILLLFAKLNPATRYVQGMNEVLAVIYYVFSTDSDEQNADNAEADSFACFVRLLSDSVDHFCQQLDNSSSVGILSTLTKLKEILRINDEELWRHLEFISKVNPQFYAFRWITLLLTQEFEFNVVLRIWDSLLSHPFGVQDMLLRVCCALLLCVKSQLLSGDFAANLYLLQHYPAVNIENVLELAKEINTDTSSSLAVSI